MLKALKHKTMVCHMGEDTKYFEGGQILIIFLYIYINIYYACVCGLKKPKICQHAVYGWHNMNSDALRSAI